MNLSYYNEEVDKILEDIIDNDYFTENDFPDIVKYVTNTIYQYDTNLKKNKLKSVVDFLINSKYQKLYFYDAESDFNKRNKIISESDTMSVCESDLSNTEEELREDRVNLDSYLDLASHRKDYSGDAFKENIYVKRNKLVSKLKKIPQHQQKTPGWFDQREECLTATAVATALDEDPYKHPAELLQDKCGKGVPFVENANVHHGKKYEEIGNMYYSFRNNIYVSEFGLLQHEKHRFIGASPDGICEKYTPNKEGLSKLVGRALEIKFPKTRKINTEGELDGDICPHYYFVQVQTQLFVTGLDECDFLQCQLEEYDSWEDFVQDSHKTIPTLSKETNLEKGCLIQLLPKKMIGQGDPLMCLYNAKYLYPPKLHMTIEEIEKWVATETINFRTNELSEEYMIDKVLCWRFAKIACHLIKADTKWFESKLPQLKQFWEYVLFYRTNKKKLDNLVTFIQEVGVKKTAEIFERVHKDYASVNKTSKYKPLYQEKTAWREKYDKKYAGYERFKNFQNNKKSAK